MSRRHQPVKSFASPTQVADRLQDRQTLPEDLLTTIEAAQRLRFTGANPAMNFLKWAHRKRVPCLRRGRICLWQPAVLMAFLRRDAWTRDRHGETVTRFAADRTRTSGDVTRGDE